MTRSAAAVLSGLLTLEGCAGAARSRVSEPAAPAIDLSPFRRVWIAGFVTAANREVDVNAETVRLLRSRLNPRTPLRVIEAPPLSIDETKLSDAARWKRLAEEYGEPLIVTGSVSLVAARPVPAESPSGRASYRLRKGFVLDALFLFIDGRTGEVLARQDLPKQTLYGPDQRASTLSLYLQLMERVLPAFLRAFR